MEICLTSNLNTNTVRTIQNHPFAKYIKQKVRVTLNTDNRLISNTNLSNEYQIAIDNFNLEKNDIKTIIINGFKSAFLPHQRRVAMVNEIVEELDSEFNFC